MAEVFFFLASIGALAGAIGTVALRNPFYSVLALIVHLVSLAGLFLLVSPLAILFALVTNRLQYDVRGRCN
jgi:NADH:ubiquinone oxidoreductase subunit 6 (subunit J)